MEVWQNEGQLPKRVRLEIMLLSLKYSLISREQLNELKIMRSALLSLTIPPGIWRAWKGRNWSDFAGWAGQNSSRGKTEHPGPWLGVNGAGIGENMSFWGLAILARCTGMMPPGARGETGEVLVHSQAAWPPIHCCLSLAQGQQCGDVCSECSARRRIPFLC